MVHSLHGKHHTVWVRISCADKLYHTNNKYPAHVNLSQDQPNLSSLPYNLTFGEYMGQTEP